MTTDRPVPGWTYRVAEFPGLTKLSAGTLDPLSTASSIDSIVHPRCAIWRSHLATLLMDPKYHRGPAVAARALAPASCGAMAAFAAPPAPLALADAPPPRTAPAPLLPATTTTPVVAAYTQS